MGEAGGKPNGSGESAGRPGAGPVGTSTDTKSAAETKTSTDTAAAADRSAADKPAAGTKTTGGAKAEAGDGSGAAAEALAARIQELTERRKISLGRRLLLIGRRTVFILLGLAALLIAGFAIAYALTPIPSAQSTAAAQGSVFYYADGKTVFAKQGTNRVVV